MTAGLSAFKPRPVEPIGQCETEAFVSRKNGKCGLEPDPRGERLREARTGISARTGVEQEDRHYLSLREAAPPRALLAVQNGMEARDVADRLGSRVGIFVGGDTEWKERTIGAWAALGRKVGCWVHVGRVNTCRRIAICTAEDVTSFDGSSASRFAKTVPKMDAARRQIGLPRADDQRVERLKGS